MKYKIAASIANNIFNELQPHCTIIHIAGSIRRQAEDIGDIEIMCRPKCFLQEDLFGSTQTEMRSNKFIDAVKALGEVITGSASAGRQCKVLLPEGLKLDMFITDQQINALSVLNNMLRGVNSSIEGIQKIADQAASDELVTTMNINVRNETLMKNYPPYNAENDIETINPAFVDGCMAVCISFGGQPATNGRMAYNQKRLRDCSSNLNALITPTVLLKTVQLVMDDLKEQREEIRKGINELLSPQNINTSICNS